MSTIFWRFDKKQDTKYLIMKLEFGAIALDNEISKPNITTT